MKIIISETVETATQATELLNKISSHILEGYTRGFYPHWHIEFENEEEAMQFRNDYEETLPE